MFPVCTIDRIDPIDRIDRIDRIDQNTKTPKLTGKCRQGKGQPRLNTVACLL